MSSADGDAVLDQPDRLHRQRADQPGGDEAGDVPVDHDAGLADRLGEGPRRVEGLVAGLVAADQLAQRHHRHRREEVGADDRLGPLGHRGDLGDRDRAGVGAEHRAVPADPVQLAEDLLLDLEALERRLDDDVGRRRPRPGRWSSVIRAERGLGVGLLEGALGDEPATATSRWPPGPRPSASSVTSRSTTSCPATAATWAMPEPISPAPTTAECVDVAVMGGEPNRGAAMGETGPGAGLERADHLGRWWSASSRCILRWAYGGRGRSLVERRPTAGGADEYGLMVAVAAPGTFIEGEVARQRLADAGIRAQLVTTTDGPRLMVLRGGRDPARRLLAAPEPP